MHSFKLRDYQVADIAAIRAAFMHYRRVLYVLSTAGGKTVIFAYITAQAAAKGNRVIIVAHRQEIVDQICIALSLMGVPHGRIQPDQPMTGHLVQVAMVQTLARRLKTIPEPQLLIIDEAHHAVADTYTQIIRAWHRVPVLGVTATPERLDGRGLGDVFEVMVLGPGMRELIDRGYIASFRYLAPTTTVDLSRVRSIGGDYNVHDLEKALDHDGIIGDVVEHYLRHVAPRSALVFCVTVAHAERVAQQFRDRGIPAASIDGTMPSKQRRLLVDQLRDGTIRVLVSCEIISEGFDVPAVGGVILLRPTQSLALYLQQIGRGLRRKDDGSPVVILDHVGNVFRHGLPDAPRTWSLDSRQRSAEEREQQAAHVANSIRTCRECRIVLPVGSTRDLCPMPGVAGCMFPRPRILSERGGELQEVLPPEWATPDWAGGIDIRSATGWFWFELLDRAGADPARLRQIQVARGYKPSWVGHALARALERQRQRGAA